MGDSIVVVLHFPTVADGDEIVVSATMYVTYLRCPDQALARYEGRYPRDSRASFRGQLAHRVFARHLSQGPIDPDAFDLACREEIGSAMNPKVAAVGLKPSSLTAVIHEVGDLYARFKQLSHDGIRATEVLLEVTPTPGVSLRGSVDAIFDSSGGQGTRLVDWKTGNLGHAEDQLAFYALLWGLVHGRLPERVEALSVATGERFTHIPTWRDLQATADAVGGIVTILRTAVDVGSRLERIGGGWCSYCPILDECPEGAAAAAVFGPSSF